MILKFILVLPTLMAITACTVASLPPLDSIPEAKLQVVSISLKEGTPVTRSSVIVAELEYELRDVDERYLRNIIISPQVATTQPGLTTDGTFPLRSHPRLENQNGTVSFEFPVTYVWDGFLNYAMKTPVEIHYKLLYRTGPGRTVVLATSDVFIFED